MRKLASDSSDPFASFGGAPLPASMPTRQEARHARAAAAGVDPQAADALRQTELKEAARVRSAKWRAARKLNRAAPASSLTRGQKAAATRAANELKASAPANMTRGEKASFTRRMNRLQAGLPASHAGEKLGARRRTKAASTETIAPAVAASARSSVRSTLLTLPQSAIDAIDAEIGATQARLDTLKRTRASVVIG